MIIKSMARKAATFEQLIGYIARDADSEEVGAFARNLYHSGENKALVADQFQRNARYLPKRKNGNVLYHEVIVLENQDHIPKRQQAQILNDLAERYCSRRAPDQLAWGRVHFNSDYPHIHLMISANGVRSQKRVRLERNDFGAIQREIEDYRFERYPELNGERVYRRDRHKETPKMTKDEGEMKRRTGEPSDKETVAKNVAFSFALSTSGPEFREHLWKYGLTYYQRGQTAGVQHNETGRKYRLKTLGLNEKVERIKALAAKPGQQVAERENDARASGLLKPRAAMESEAKEQLEMFEREQGEDR